MEYYDAVSSITHLFMAVWAAFAGLLILRLTRGHGYGRWAVGVYALTMVVLYLASGVFHGLLYLATDTRLGPEYRDFGVSEMWIAQRVDKCAIFALIAGSYTPVFVYLLAGAWRKWCLIAVWSAVAVGVAMIWLWPSHPLKLLVMVYVALGLVGLLPMPKYLARLDKRGIAWVATFGTIFVAGAMAEVFWWPTIVPGYFGPHEVLHVADMLGTFLHFCFVVKFLIFEPPPVDEAAACRRCERERETCEACKAHGIAFKSRNPAGV